jgi:hypothetical protein
LGAFLIARTGSCAPVDLLMAGGAYVSWSGKLSVALSAFVVLFGLRLLKDWLNAGSVGARAASLPVALTMISVHACVAGLFILVPLYPAR